MMPMSDRYHHVLQKLRTAVRTMMAADGSPRARLRLALAADLLQLEETEFPAGALRHAFAFVRARIQAASPAPISPENLDEALRYLSDTEVLWMIERLHTLAFAMAMHVGVNQADNGKRASVR